MHTNSSPHPLRRFFWALAVGAGLLLPTVAVLGVQEVEERYFLGGPRADFDASDLVDAYRRSGQFGLRVSTSEAPDELRVEYHAVGVRWLLRLLNGPPDQPSAASMIGFRSTLNPLRSLPAFLLLGALSWWLAGPLARRSGRKTVLGSVLLLAIAGATHGGERHTFERSEVLEVEVRSSSNEPLPGATVALCRYDDDVSLHNLEANDCRVRFADAQGRCRFESTAAGEYALMGELPGFASTAVYPLSIRGEDPLAPDQILLVLNPVCWDC